MPIRPTSSITERNGVNYVRSVFEAENCLFKEIPKDYDYGLDAIVGLVEGDKVLPTEIAVQIKSGSSYIVSGGCRVYCTREQIDYWVGHPMRTYCIVYDPNEKCAYSCSLKEADFEPTSGGNFVLNFDKHEWNRFNTSNFKEIWFPLSLRRLPDIDFEKAKEWACKLDEISAYLGGRVLFKKYGGERETWDFFLSLFETREVGYLHDSIFYYLAHIPETGDIFWNGKWSNSFFEFREDLRARFEKYGRLEVLKLLHQIDDHGFERGSIGRSMGMLIVLIPNFKEHLKSIMNEFFDDEKINWLGKFLLNYEDEYFFYNP